MGRHEIAASIRMRAELARRLSTEIKEPTSAAALREIARQLYQEAIEVEENAVTIKPPLTDAWRGA
jgi:hypothetical protein